MNTPRNRYPNNAIKARRMQGTGGGSCLSAGSLKIYLAGDIPAGQVPAAQDRLDRWMANNGRQLVDLVEHSEKALRGRNNG